MPFKVLICKIDIEELKVNIPDRAIARLIVKLSIEDLLHELFKYVSSCFLLCLEILIMIVVFVLQVEGISFFIVLILLKGSLKRP